MLFVNLLTMTREHIFRAHSSELGTMATQAKVKHMARGAQPEERWMFLYRTIFPGVTAPPSPCKPSNCLRVIPANKIDHEDSSEEQVAVGVEADHRLQHFIEDADKRSSQMVYSLGLPVHLKDGKSDDLPFRDDSQVIQCKLGDLRRILSETIRQSVSDAHSRTMMESVLSTRHGGHTYTRPNCLEQLSGPCGCRSSQAASEVTSQVADPTCTGQGYRLDFSNPFNPETGSVTWPRFFGFDSGLGHSFSTTASELLTGIRTESTHQVPILKTVGERDTGTSMQLGNYDFGWKAALTM